MWYSVRCELRSTVCGCGVSCVVQCADATRGFSGKQRMVERSQGVHSANQRPVRDFFSHITQIKNEIYDVFHYKNFSFVMART